jgi:hypothetical protein
MVGEHQHLIVLQFALEGGVAGAAGRGLAAFPVRVLDCDAHDRQRHAERGAGLPAVVGPGVGLGMQAVVDVDRTQPVHPQGRCGEPVQQHRGIEPAAETDEQRTGDAVWQRGGDHRATAYAAS